MKNVEAEVVHRPSLTIKQVLVTAEVPVPDASLEIMTGDPNARDMRKASFYVNTETWECKGEVAGHPVLADKQWWKDQCQRVADRVREGLSTLTV